MVVSGGGCRRSAGPTGSCNTNRPCRGDDRSVILCAVVVSSKQRRRPVAAGDDEPKVRAERARSIGPFCFQLIRETADPAPSTNARWCDRCRRAHRPVRVAGAELAAEPWTGGSGVSAPMGSTRCCPAHASARPALRRRRSNWRWRLCRPPNYADRGVNPAGHRGDRVGLVGITRGL